MWTITAQWLLLHNITAPIWYETARWRKVSRVFFNTWWFGGYQKASWRSVLEFFAAVIQNATMIIKRRGHTTIAWKGHQKASFGIPCRLLKSWFVIGANRCENSARFSANLSGRRPPRSINLYTARNIRQLNNTTIPLRAVLYLVEVYG